MGKKTLAHPTLLIRFIMLENFWRKYLYLNAGQHLSPIFLTFFQT